MDVQAILDSKQAKYKSTEVHKEVELQYDLGNLLATDHNALDSAALRYIISSPLLRMLPKFFLIHRDRKDEYLKEVARDNTQLLLNKLWEVYLACSAPRKIDLRLFSLSLAAHRSRRWISSGTGRVVRTSICMFIFPWYPFVQSAPTMYDSPSKRKKGLLNTLFVKSDGC